jgi:exopolyphosphatase/guanosine-5'-triphosphate,3'-diphosphate pyrophosphatase
MSGSPAVENEMRADVARSRVAAIDVGTNAIRFLAVESDGGEGFHVLAETRLPIRLGHGVFGNGRIDAGAATEAVEGLATVNRQIRELSIGRYRAVATSAVRESPDRRGFVRRVREEAGIRLEVIAGAEEIRLVHTAVRRRITLGVDPWLLIELGGGSVEIALVDASRILWSETHAMGAVRLVELFARGGEDPGRFSRLVEEYASTIRLPDRIIGRPVDGLIATGGNSEAIARICRSGSESAGTQSVSLSEVRKLIGELAAMSVQDRQRSYGLRADRADVILPAAIVYAVLLERVGAREMLVPGGGVKEGIVVELLQGRRERLETRQKGIEDDALALGRKFLFDENHGQQVARLASALFDQLKPIHGMGEKERRILRTAALLHDVGGFVSYKGHHKHSMYLIARAELPGFTPREMHLMGAIARYHRKAAPSTLHPEFSQLPAADRERVRRCAALLRVADALDKEHRQKIQDVNVSVKGRIVQIRVEGANDLLLEQWALKKKDDLFRDVFSFQITLLGAGEPGHE